MDIPTETHDLPVEGDQPSRLAWFGVLTGPIAWIVQLFGSWILAEVIGCARGNRPLGQILGLRVTAFAGIVNAVLFGLTVLAGALSYRELRSIRGRDDPSPERRATWLATAGVMTSALFAILIAASFLPIALVEGCTA